MKLQHWILSFIWFGAMLIVLNTSRVDFQTLLSFYTIAFAAYAILVFHKSGLSLKHGLILAFACRLAGFFFVPLLSDDYYRFIWDGMVMEQGLNPSAFTPTFLINDPEKGVFNHHLYSLLNSQDYFTVYPPVAQFFFYVSFMINDHNITGHITFYKIILLLADLSVILLLKNLLQRLCKPLERLLIYALNPLIIIEFTGNLHMEGIMIAFLLAAIFMAEKQKWVWSSVFSALSISTKLLSLILIPFIPRQLDFRRTFLWCIATIGISGIIIWQFFGAHLGWFQSVGLWFRSFEFNASVYYVFQQLHEYWKGYENIKLVGPVMALITLLLIGMVWFIYRKEKQIHWSTAMVIVMTIYFLMTTTLHPWYLGTLLALCVISGLKFPIVWTYLVFLSYSHYADNSFTEKYLFIIAEYLLLFSFIAIELRKEKALTISLIPNRAKKAS